uniref:Uncharacterized protein n=1 Tax=Anguilla anguilla TaxID=7936 RepID=A0A0E9XIA1_ANGAN
MGNLGGKTIGGRGKLHF